VPVSCGFRSHGRLKAMAATPGGGKSTAGPDASGGFLSMLRKRAQDFEAQGGKRRGKLHANEVKDEELPPSPSAKAAKTAAKGRARAQPRKDKQPSSPASPPAPPCPRASPAPPSTPPPANAVTEATPAAKKALALAEAEGKAAEMDPAERRRLWMQYLRSRQPHKRNNESCL